MVAGAGHSPFEAKEKDPHIEFERNSDGGWNVHGHGENMGKPFVWTDVVTKTGEVKVYREHAGSDRGKVEQGTPGRLTTGGPPPPQVGLETALLQTAGVNGGTAEERRDEALKRRKDLLHWRAGQGIDVGVQAAHEPEVGEAEISTVHFLVHSEKYWGKRFCLYHPWTPTRG